jgi:RNA polymerase sigma factor (sigma-70 family)
VVYGMPTTETLEAAGRGEVVLAGCCPCLGPQCQVCGAPLPSTDSVVAPSRPRDASGGRPDDSELEGLKDIALRVARRQLRDRAVEGLDAEDVVQDVMLRFLQQDLAEISNPAAWVTTATKNRCLDLLRAGGRHKQQPLGEEKELLQMVLGPSHAAMGPAMVEYALAGLSQQEKELLRLQVEGWTSAEIASMFGFANAGSVGVALARARKKVRDRFAGADRHDILGQQRPY